jgi:hypothetical protein
MKVTNRPAGKAYADGYAKGRDDERQQAESTITALKRELNNALSEVVKLTEAAKNSQ